MTISFDNRTSYGQMLFVASLVTFFIFILSAVVLGNNQREDWKPTKRQKLASFILHFYFPRESIKERVIGWHKPYVYSAFLAIPLLGALFFFASRGILCTFS